MCTHNLCFEQKKKKCHIFSSENYHFYSREILQYIAQICLRNAKWHFPILAYFLRPFSVTIAIGKVKLI